MLRRPLIAPAIAVLAIMGLAACTPGTAVATPSPTELSEEEAYAQAEDAFRAYVDAVNAIDISDPSTFQPAFDLSTGTQNALDRKQYSAWHADGWVKSGELSVTLVKPATFDSATAIVELDVCLDVSRAVLVDSNGVSQVTPNRPNVVGYTVELTSTPASYLVADSFDRSGEPQC